MTVKKRKRTLTHVEATAAHGFAAIYDLFNDRRWSQVLAEEDIRELLGRLRTTIDEHCGIERHKPKPRKRARP